MPVHPSPAWVELGGSKDWHFQNCLNLTFRTLWIRWFLLVATTILWPRSSHRSGDRVSSSTATIAAGTRNFSEAFYTCMPRIPFTYFYCHLINLYQKVCECKRVYIPTHCVWKLCLNLRICQHHFPFMWCMSFLSHALHPLQRFTCMHVFAYLRQYGIFHPFVEIFVNLFIFN